MTEQAGSQLSTHSELNEVPVGYKQTEVGVIPKDWDCRSLGDLCSLKSGLGITSKNIDGNSEYRCYGGNGLRGYTKQFTHEGEYALIGRQGALCGNIQHVTGKFFASEHALVATPNKGVNSKWLAIYLEQMNLNQYSESSAQPGLSAEKLRILNLIAPTSQEQTAIANALSDVDALISELEKLIAKKQAIKTATMQQLLTGRTRLPQFAQREDGTPKGTKPSELGEIPEDWEFLAMGNMGSTYGGLSGKSKQDFGHGNSLYVPFTNVMANVVVDVNNLEKVNIQESQNNLASGDLLFNGSSETPEEVCFAALVSVDIKKLYLNSFCFGFRSNQKNAYLPLYLAYWFRSEAGRAAVSIMAQGSTRYNISKSQFMKLNIILPSREEQTAIATILSDMDAEIQALEQRLNKTRQIKQGMMQELLTGKTRLVKPESQTMEGAHYAS